MTKDSKEKKNNNNSVHCTKTEAESESPFGLNRTSVLFGVSFTPVGQYDTSRHTWQTIWSLHFGWAHF